MAYSLFIGSVGASGRHTVHSTFGIDLYYFGSSMAICSMIVKIQSVWSGSSICKKFVCNLCTTSF